MARIKARTFWKSSCIEPEGVLNDQSPKWRNFSFWGGALSASDIFTRSISVREFQLGTSLPVVANQLRVKSSEAKAIHERPAVIQELAWQAPFTDSSQRAEFR